MLVSIWTQEVQSPPAPVPDLMTQRVQGLKEGVLGLKQNLLWHGQIPWGSKVQVCIYICIYTYTYVYNIYTCIYTLDVYLTYMCISMYICSFTRGLKYINRTYFEPFGT